LLGGVLCLHRRGLFGHGNNSFAYFAFWGCSFFVVSLYNICAQKSRYLLRFSRFFAVFF
jgi:hypothetical protein